MRSASSRRDPQRTKKGRLGAPVVASSRSCRPPRIGCAGDSLRWRDRRVLVEPAQLRSESRLPRYLGRGQSLFLRDQFSEAPACRVSVERRRTQASKFNLLNNAGIMERRLRETDLPLALLWPAWFMENFAWDIPSARQGRIESHLQPLDRAVDMVSVQDIGRVVAELLTETWERTRVVELSGDPLSERRASRWLPVAPAARLARRPHRVGTDYASA